MLRKYSQRKLDSPHGDGHCHGVTATIQHHAGCLHHTKTHMFIARIIIPGIFIAATGYAQLPPSALIPAKEIQLPPLAQPQPQQAPELTEVKLTPPVPRTPPSHPVVKPAPEPAPMPDVVEEPEPSQPSDASANKLTPEEQAQGWKLLFDGKNLVGLKGVRSATPLSTGWKIVGDELKLPKKIMEMDKVTGGDLITTESYLDFEFRFQWKLSTSSNSGIRYLLTSTFGQSPAGLEYQIIDDVHNPISLKGGRLRRSGALDNVLPVGANARINSADPLNKIATPWNEGRILVQGNHVEHWLNGAKVLEFELGPQLHAAATKNGARVGPGFGTKTRTQITLLDEGTSVSFRNLKIRPIAAQQTETPAPPPPGEKATPAQ